MVGRVVYKIERLHVFFLCLFVGLLLLSCGTGTALYFEAGNESHSSVGFVNLLRRWGYKAQLLSARQTRRNTFDRFGLVFVADSVSIDYLRIRDYVENGGGLVLLGTSAMLLADAFRISDIACLRIHPTPDFEPGDCLPGQEETQVEINLIAASETNSFTRIGILEELLPWTDSAILAIAYGAATAFYAYDGSDFVVMAAAEVGKGRIVALTALPETNSISRAAGFVPLAWVKAANAQKLLIDMATEWITGEKPISWQTSIGHRLANAGPTFWSVIGLFTYLGILSVYFVPKLLKKARKKG